MGAEDDGGSDDGVISANATVEESRIRIYVGGLGGNVSEDDLKKTFSSTQMGLVDSVEIVRSKGRSIAYLDFVPFSDNGLSKLFSKYNGCVWKGGKLRLEKAKEHYTTRLRREWAENNAICSNSEVHNKEEMEPLVSKKLMKNDDSEKMYLQLFFPRLKKIKPIPFKGTGKHKYSFQHIKLPALPRHFCDCEEHSSPSELVCQETVTYADKESVGMNKEELDTMNSVLSKILAKEGRFATYNKAEVSLESDNLTNSTDHLHINDIKEDRGSDDDNLIINVVAGGSNILSFSDFGDANANTANKVSQASKKGPAMNVLTSNKKRKAPLEENVDRNSLYSVTSLERKNALHQNTDKLKILPNPSMEKSAWKHLNSNNATFHISDITQSFAHGADLQGKPDNITEDSSVTMENEIIQLSKAKEQNSADAVLDTSEVAANKTTKHNSWAQKSSWMQLIGEPSNSSFCISQVLSGLNTGNQERSQMNFDELSTVNDEHKKSQEDVSLSETIRNEDNPIINNSDYNTQHSKQHLSVKLLQAGSIGNELSTVTVAKRNQSKLQQASKTAVGVDPYSFVRSAASMKEWKKAKEALSRPLKKKKKIEEK